MRKVPPLDVCAGKVAATIREKDAKFEEPFHLLRHINLIVVDQTNLLAHLPVPPFYLHYCTPDLRRALLASRFREVFFLTTFKSGRAFVPMKMLVTLARLYFFHTACCSTPHLQFEDVHEFTELFARHLSTVAVGPVGFRREQGESEMLYGDSGFLISKGLGVTVRLYHDGVWPTSAAEVPKTAVLDAGLPPFGLTILSDQLLAEASYEIGAMRGLNRLSA